MEVLPFGPLQKIIKAFNFAQLGYGIECDVLLLGTSWGTS
jgi:hypothetical protein